MPRGMRFECLIYVTSLSGAEKAVPLKFLATFLPFIWRFQKTFSSSPRAYNISEPVVIRFGAGEKCKVWQSLFAMSLSTTGFLYTNIPRKFSSRASITAAGKFMHTHTRGEKRCGEQISPPRKAPPSSRRFYFIINLTSA